MHFLPSELLRASISSATSVAVALLVTWFAGGVAWGARLPTDSVVIDAARTKMATMNTGSSKPAPVIRRLIVTFADPALANASRANAKLTPGHDAALTGALGAPAHVMRAMVGGAWVVELMQAVDMQSALAMGHALEASGVAQMAAPDYPLHALLTPNDPDFTSGLQWYLKAWVPPAPHGIDAVDAWDLTTGDASMVIAVVDTGFTSHPDLAGKTVPGYDFIADVTDANDGDGRDPDASDPGDGRSAGMCPSPYDNAQNSSWHGTIVAGVIGAMTNNSTGIAGANWNARLQPIRVLGRCGASTADILDGASWAAGLPVPGIPPNATPARVINISLGGQGSCVPQYQKIFDQILDKGVFVAVAAGNDNAEAFGYFPASCIGVSTVAATDNQGARASYSNFSAGMDISAPGGDVPRHGITDSIISTWNNGAMAPGMPGYVNVDGTSVAAPLVSAVASLMLTVNPNLTPAQIKDLMAKGATAFAAGSDCLTGICGAGIVNAFTAVQAAQSALSNPIPSEVVEFHNAAQDHYFISASPQEISDLDNGVHPGWQRTGYTFHAYTAAVAGLSPVCRFYIPPANGDSHFFSASPDECAQTQAKFPTFVYEAANVFYIALPNSSTGACPTGTDPVYRLFDNRTDANHRYTTVTDVVDQMKAMGWIAEGYGPGPYFPIMCAPQ